MVRLVAEPSQVRPGDVGEIGVYIDPIQLRTTGVQVFADFDPARLAILSVDTEPDSRFEVALSGEFDNIAGTVNVSAGTLGQSVGSSFKLATIRYRALQISGQTEVSVSVVSPRDTVASIAGQSLLTLMQSAVISIQLTAVVDLRILPESIDVRLDQVFELEIVVEPNGGAVTGVQAFLNFDPHAIEVLSVVPAVSSPLVLVLVNRFDNESGTLDFAAGSLIDSATTSFLMVRITARTRISGVVTEIDFSSEKLRVTIASVGGDAVQRDLFGSSITVSPMTDVSLTNALGLLLIMAGFAAGFYLLRRDGRSRIASIRR